MGLVEDLPKGHRRLLGGLQGGLIPSGKFSQNPSPPPPPDQERKEVWRESGGSCKGVGGNLCRGETMEL